MCYLYKFDSYNKGTLSFIPYLVCKLSINCVYNDFHSIVFQTKTN